jgi:hemin uptake protein HemP
VTQAGNGELSGHVPNGTPTLTTEELFAGRDEIVLIHNGSAYRLRITRQNKLILTK